MRRLIILTIVLILFIGVQPVLIYSQQQEINRLATMLFTKIDHDFTATSGKYFSFTVSKEKGVVVPAL